MSLLDLVIVPSALILMSFIIIINVHSASGEYVLDRYWGTVGASDGTQFKLPSDVAIDASKNVFVADFKNKSSRVSII